MCPNLSVFKSTFSECWKRNKNWSDIFHGDLKSGFDGLFFGEMLLKTRQPLVFARGMLRLQPNTPSPYSYPTIAILAVVK
jgi:hypothetical protein